MKKYENKIKALTFSYLGLILVFIFIAFSIETILIIFCVPLSFLFHLVVYANYWKQKILTRIILGMIIVLIPFLIILI